ncbi:MAG TPA: c-type cytochrome [Methylomirabilota bacterium]|nr:c-type cytochrome [Methylomirabilota bacterium]
MTTRYGLLTGAGFALVLLAVLATGVSSAAAAGPVDAPGFSKVFTCSACHGAGGNSLSDSMPTLAGIYPAYFKKQIQDYAAGKRPSPEMEPYAKMVLVLGVDEIANYFAGQSRQPTTIAVSAAAVERGRVASAQCAICHGADGRGDPAKLVPNLGGQPPGYLRLQMLLFKAEKRSPGDANLAAIKALMKGIPEETFTDLAAYYSSLR